MTITLAVAGRIATAASDERVVAGNTYSVQVSLDAEWTGPLFMRVRFGSLYYDIPFASSDASVDVQFPVGYPEVGIGVYSEALGICTNEARVKLLRSILEQGVSVVEFDGDLYDQWAGEVTTLLTDSDFDATSDRPLKNSVITAWKNSVPIDADLVHKTGDETISGNKVLQGVLSLSRPSEPILNMKSSLVYSTEAFRSEITTTDIKDGSESKLTQVISRVQPTSSQYDVRVYKPDRSGFYDMDLRSYSDHFAILVPTYYPVDGSSNPQPLTANALVSSGNIAVDPRIVHTTGNESIAGDKTFTSVLSAYKLDTRETTAYGTGNSKCGVRFYSKNSGGNDTLYASLALWQVYTGSTARNSLVVDVKSLDGTSSAKVEIWKLEDGTARVSIPTHTPVDSSGNHLAPDFAEAINSSMLAVDPRVVHTTGTETIAGTKTFSSPVIFNGALRRIRFSKSALAGRWYCLYAMPRSGGGNTALIRICDMNNVLYNRVELGIRIGYGPGYHVQGTTTGVASNMTLAVARRISDGYLEVWASLDSNGQFIADVLSWRLNPPVLMDAESDTKPAVGDVYDEISDVEAVS